MDFSRFFIDRPIFAAVLSIVIFAAGLIAIPLLPVGEYPEVVPPSVVVRTVYPGANPKVIAETVATPLEEAINGVEDMMYVKSVAGSDGVLQLTVTFRPGTDPDEAAVRVQNRVAQAQARLPEDVRRQGVTTQKQSPVFLMVVHLTSKDGRYDSLYLRNYMRLHVKDELARIPGVGDAQQFGGRLRHAPVAGPRQGGRARPVAIWWAQFGDPVLEQLVQDALAANLDLRIAMSRVAQARAVFVEQRLDQLPHVVAGGAYDRRKQPDLQAGGGERIFSQTYQLGFDAGWELDLFGRQRRAAEAARADLGAERENLIDAQVTVAAEVARNYFELRGNQKRLEVARQMLDNLRDTQQLTQTRWDLGAGTELDVQGSRARLKAIEADIPLLEAAGTQSRHRLAVLLGQRPGALDALLRPREVPTYAKALPLGDTRQLLQRRADVRAAERRLAAATARVGVATADLFPRISLSGFVGFLSGDASGLVNGANKAWAVTPSISWAAFDFGSVRARLRASKAQAEGVAAEYEKAVLLALEDTENALTAYAKQQRRLGIVIEQAQAARRAEELARIGYREGAEDFLALLDAQRTRLDSEDALARAEAAVNTGVVAVYKAIGGWGQGNGEAPPVAMAD